MLIDARVHLVIDYLKKKKIDTTFTKNIKNDEKSQLFFLYKKNFKNFYKPIFLGCTLIFPLNQSVLLIHCPS